MLLYSLGKNTGDDILFDFFLKKTYFLESYSLSYYSNYHYHHKHHNVVLPLEQHDQTHHSLNKLVLSFNGSDFGFDTHVPIFVTCYSAGIRIVRLHIAHEEWTTQFYNQSRFFKSPPNRRTFMSPFLLLRFCKEPNMRFPWTLSYNCKATDRMRHAILQNLSIHESDISHFLFVPENEVFPFPAILIKFTNINKIKTALSSGLSPLTIAEAPTFSVLPLSLAEFYSIAHKFPGIENSDFLNCGLINLSIDDSIEGHWINSQILLELIHQLLSHFSDLLIIEKKNFSFQILQICCVASGCSAINALGYQVLLYFDSLFVANAFQNHFDQMIFQYHHEHFVKFAVSFPTHPPPIIIAQWDTTSTTMPPEPLEVVELADANTSFSPPEEDIFEEEPWVSKLIDDELDIKPIRTPQLDSVRRALQTPPYNPPVATDMLEHTPTMLVEDALLTPATSPVDTPGLMVKSLSNSIIPWRIEAGLDLRTTCMFRNIPNKFSQKMLIDFLNESHYRKYDFVYLRMDFKNRCNVGYAFINFIEPRYLASASSYHRAILSFHMRVKGMRWDNFNTHKISDLTYANVQGKEALVKKFKNSSYLILSNSQDHECRVGVSAKTFLFDWRAAGGRGAVSGS